MKKRYFKLKDFQNFFKKNGIYFSSLALSNNNIKDECGCGCDCEKFIEVNNNNLKKFEDYYVKKIFIHCKKYCYKNSLIISKNKVIFNYTINDLEKLAKEKGFNI